MGTIRGYLDAQGIEQMLYDHEGATAAEVAGPHPTESYMTHQDSDGTWWSSGWANGMPAATGRYRAECDCGWVGPVLDAATLPDDQAAWFRNDAGAWDHWPNEDGDELVLASWRRHTDQAIGGATLDGAIADWSDAKQRLGTVIADLIASGVSWDEIARQLVTTPDKAREEWGGYQPTPPPPSPGDPEWWDRLDTDLRRATFHDHDLTSSAQGRTRPGWEAATTQAMAASLDMAGVEVLDVVDVDELHLEPNPWRVPIGGLRVRWDGHDVLVGVLVDDAGEVYPNPDDPADTRQ
jgi:hypothetical protein